MLAKSNDKGDNHPLLEDRMPTKVRSTIIGVIAAFSLAAAVIPAVSQAAVPSGHGGHGHGEPVCGPLPC
jgi:hypothetical protein